MGRKLCQMGYFCLGLRREIAIRSIVADTLADCFSYQASCAVRLHNNTEESEAGVRKCAAFPISNFESVFNVQYVQYGRHGLCAGYHPLHPVSLMSIRIDVSRTCSLTCK